MWAQGLLAMLGVWLLAAPDVLDYGGAARINNHVVGAWMATFGVIAMSECVREVRWVNLVLGVWLCCGPLVLAYPIERVWESIVVGVSAIALALVRGTLIERLGGGWTALWRPAG
jgi:hypothetical protein